MIIQDFIVESKYTNIDSIVRFSQYLTHNKENVPAHSWWVCMFTSMLLDGLFVKCEDVEFYKYKCECMQYATNHDMPELFTGDISHEVKYNKYNGDKILQALNEYEDFCVNKYLGTSPEFTTFLHCKQKPEVKHLVKIADWLACIKHEYQELRTGNEQFKELLETSINSVLILLGETPVVLKDFMVSNCYFNKFIKDIKQIRELIKQ